MGVQLEMWQRTASRQTSAAHVLWIPAFAILVLPALIAVPPIAMRVPGDVSLPVLAITFWVCVAMAANRYLERNYQNASDMLKAGLQVLAIGGLCLGAVFAAVGKITADSSFGMEATCKTPDGATVIPADNGSTFTVSFDQEGPEQARTVKVKDGVAYVSAPPYWREAHFRYYLSGSTLDTSYEVLTTPSGIYQQVIRRVVSFGELTSPARPNLWFHGLICRPARGKQAD
jgi:hypothetical protein